MNRRAQSGRWICCQLGAREHYAVPRTLHRAGRLAALITDAWVPARFTRAARLPVPGFAGLRERFHPELDAAPVIAFTPSIIAFEVAHRKTDDAWRLILERNRWFQRKTVATLKGLAKSLKRRGETDVTVFAYSYAALETLRFAKNQGWRTVLGQIDPGPVEEDIVQSEHDRHPELPSRWRRAPAEYWKLWRAETDLADRIVANSEWSRRALVQIGVAAEKIAVVPLSYEPPHEVMGEFAREYPATFSAARPLRVLFLGQLVLRKGLAALLRAAAALESKPIEFRLVGGSELPESALLQTPNVRWFGRASRAETSEHYRRADVFLFPTLSDGFGLTQLEAQSWRLPVIASAFCGEVVTHDRNGLLLAEPTAERIVEALEFCLQNPHRLLDFSRRAGEASAAFHLETLHDALQGL